MKAVKTVRYMDQKLQVMQSNDGRFFTDVYGDWFDTIEEAVKDGMDTMKSKAHGTFRPSPREAYYERMERLHGLI